MAEYEVELPVRVKVTTEGGALRAHSLALAAFEAITDRTDTQEMVFVPVHERGYWPSRVRETLASRQARRENSP
jgi:hypothetical protein